MAVAITATAQPDDARIRLGLSGLTGVTTFTVTRILASGYEQPVRGAVNLKPLGDAYVLFDYEAPISNLVTYRVDSVPTASVTSAPVQWESNQDWVKDLSRPDRNMAVVIEACANLDWEQRMGVLTVLNRRTPVAILDVRQASRGTITFATLTRDDYWAFLALVSDGLTLLVQTPPERGLGNLYVAPGKLTEHRATRIAHHWARRWDMEFVEVSPPQAAGIVGAETSYQQVVDVYLTYSDVVAGEATYLDLMESVGEAETTTANRPPLLPWRGN